MLTIIQGSFSQFTWLNIDAESSRVIFQWNPSELGHSSITTWQITINDLHSDISHTGIKVVGSDVPINIAGMSPVEFYVDLDNNPPSSGVLNQPVEFEILLTPLTVSPTEEVLSYSVNPAVQINRFEWDTNLTDNTDTTPTVDIYTNNPLSLPMEVTPENNLGGNVDWEFITADTNIEGIGHLEALPSGLTGSFTSSVNQSNLESNYYDPSAPGSANTDVVPVITADHTPQIGSFVTALKGVDNDLGLFNLPDDDHFKYFVIGVNVLQEAIVDASTSILYTKDNHTVTQTITYTCQIEQGSNSAFDLTLSSQNHPSATTPTFKDTSNNTITTIPYYGTTTFKVEYAQGNITSYGTFGGVYVQLVNGTENRTIVSNDFSIQYINADGFGLNAYIGEDEDPTIIDFEGTAGNQISIPITVNQKISGTETFTIITDIGSSLINQSDVTTFSFDGSALTITENLNIHIDSNQPTGSGTFDFQLVDVNDVVIDTGTVNLEITGAVVNFSIPSSIHNLPQGGNVSIDINVILEDNGVPFTSPLELVSSGSPDGVEFFMADIVPTTTGGIYSINAIIDENASITRRKTVTFTLKNSLLTGLGYDDVISSSVSIKVDVQFSSVANYNRGNTITEHNGVIRVYPGNEGKIKGETATPIWIGHIDRTYFNKIYDPIDGYYVYSSFLEPFGSPSEFIWSEQNGTSNNFGNETHYYKIAQIYDGVQRSMLGSALEGDYSGDTSNENSDNHTFKYGSLVIKIPQNTFNNRITELEVYRSDKVDGEYSRILNIPLVDGVIASERVENATTTGTTFTGTVKNSKTMYTDLPELSPTATGHDPDSGFITDTFENSSHWVVTDASGDLQYATFKDRNRNWDYFQDLNIDANGIASISYNTNDSDHSSGATTIPHTSNGTLFNDSVYFKNYIRHMPNTFSSFRNGTVRNKSTPKIACKMYRGRDLIYCTQDTGGEDGLVGKYIRYTVSNSTQIRQITANKGKFIQVNKAWDGEDDISGATFSIFKGEADIQYSKVTENNIVKLKVTFNDMKFSSVGSDPNKDIFSQKVNGKYGLMLNGRFWQGNVTLDPGGRDEKNPYWVTYSEIDQPDNNPVSNVLTFIDKEGGEITGISSLYDKLVVMKKYALYLVDCPSNVSPSNWRVSESIHNIGNISENGFINHGNKLYSIFYDGIYQLIPNNLAESDTTPTENLKITDAIQDIYDTIHDKTDIISIYDQYRDEILFRWHRNPKNMVKNSDFASGASYWEMDAESGGIIADTEKYSGSFSSSVDVDGDMGASPGNGFISDFIPVDPTKTYSVSAYAKCPDLTNGNFYVGYLYYDESKNRIGDYPRIKKFSSSSDSWQRYSKVITSFPTGAKYVRLRSYWWTSSNIDMPQGIGYCDQWQFEQGDTTAWESYESSQEIWAFSIVTGKWRQIHTTGSVGHFTLDSDAIILL